MRFLMLITLAVSVSWSATVYVSPAGTDGAGRGGSSAPFRTIQYAVTAVEPYPWPDTIILEDGTYHEHNIKIRNFLTIASRFLFDGDTAHVRNCIVDGDSTMGDSGSVFLFLGLSGTNTFRLKGFTITRGTGTTDNFNPLFPRYYGGALFFARGFQGECWMDITRMHFINNAVERPNPSGGASSGYGGVIEFGTQPRYAVTFSNCLFQGNGASESGSIVDFNYLNTANTYSASASITFSSCSFNANRNMLNDGRNTAGVSVGMTFSGCTIRRNGFIGRDAVYTVTNSTIDSSTSSAFSYATVVANGSTFRNNSNFCFNACSVMVTRCVFADNRYQLAEGGSFWARNTLFYDNSGIMVRTDRQVTLLNCTVNSPNAVNLLNNAVVRMVNTIFFSTISGPVPRLTASYCFLNSSIASNLTTQSVRNVFDVDPVFVNAAADDYHLKAYSPAIDAGDPDSAFNLEVSPAGGRIDIGAYGNTNESTPWGSSAKMVVSPSPMGVHTFSNEILFDTFTITNSGTDPLLVTYTDSIVFPVSGYSCTGMSRAPMTWLSQGQGLDVYFTYTSGTGVSLPDTAIGIKFRSSDGYRTRIACPTLTQNSFDDVFSNAWVCPSVQVGSSVTDTFFLRNNGHNAVRVTNASESHPDLSNLGRIAGGFPLTVAPGDSFGLRVTYTPSSVAAMQTNITISTPNVVGGTDNTLVFSSAGAANTKPTARITSITPSHSIPWGQTFDAVGIADDLDGFGADPQIRGYTWRIGDTIVRSTASLTGISTAKLPVGWAKVKFTAIDNESTWADTAVDSVQVLSLLPKVDSLWADRGLILNTGAQVTFGLSAHDQDEGAAWATNHGDIVSVTWVSATDGVLGTGYTLSIPGSRLTLGLQKIYARVTDDEGDSVTSDTIRIPVQTAIGRAVLVAGTAFTDYAYFFQNISPNCNWAYRKLRDRGFTNLDIYYMNPVSWQSLDDPYVNAGIVDTSVMTLEVLRSYLLSAAVRTDVANGVPLIVNLIGHGTAAQQNGRFYLSETEYLVPDTLAAWLNSYGDIGGPNQIILILDFCYSGAFQTKLRTALDQNRVVITSADASNAAYFKNGRSFSWNVWYDVYRGENLATCFNDAKQWSDQNAPGAALANPQINADRNALYNTTADLAIAQGIYIGGSQRLQGLTSTVDSVWAVQSTAPVTVTARVRGGMTAMWFRVIPPGFSYATGSVGSLPVVAMSRVNDSTWQGTYSGRLFAGRYLFTVDGTDGSGNPAMGNSVTFDNTVVTVLAGARQIPRQFSMTVAPDHGGARIAYGLPHADNVTIRLYDMRGGLVKVLENRQMGAGYHQASWDGRDASGARCGAGYYVCRMTVGKAVLKKSVLSMGR